MASNENVQIDADDVSEYRIKSARHFRRYALALSIHSASWCRSCSARTTWASGTHPSRETCRSGSSAHVPNNSRWPVNWLVATLSRSRCHASPQRLTAAIRRKKAYGGLDVSDPQPHLYIASAAGPTAASLMRTAFTAAVQRLTREQVDQLTRQGQPVPAATVKGTHCPAADN